MEFARPPIQIVATVGPASRALVPALWQAGASAFRFNASHMSADDLEEAVAETQQEIPDCPVIVDLQGAKMRLGDFEARPVRRGDRFRFSQSGPDPSIPLPHAELFASVENGETLSCDDDRLRFSVTGVSQGALDAIALSDGELRPRKGVNLLEHPVSLCDLSATDISIVRRIAHRGRLSFAFSFMKDGNEAGWIRRYAPGRAVVGKVERREAASDVRRLARSVDALWICRGDLGAQLGPAAMARWVGSYDPRAETCPVLMAGHVLEHLTAHAAPTRAEVCHLYDLVKRGYAGFVLSDETAVGKDPVAAVGILRGLLISFLDERRNGI